MIYEFEQKLIREYNGELMQIEAWGKNSVRVRATKSASFLKEDWALMQPESTEVQIRIAQKQTEETGQKVNAAEFIWDDSAEMINGKLKVILNKRGKLRFENQEKKLLLQEYEYDRQTALNISSREMKCHAGSNFKASLKFASDSEEKLFGMGQYQNGVFNLKGSFLELAQRNSQVSVPFLYSDKGYGFLWNNPAVGRVTFGTNMTEWKAESTKQIDFWITAGDSPKEILENYMEATGKPPMMPEHGLGFWQCKLRYQTQEELLNVAKEYHKRGIPLDVIIADFFHWSLEGIWAFDETYWPDPEGMVKELEEIGTKLMVSVWPTVSIHAPNYEEMKARGELVRTENGVNINMLLIDPTSFVDMMNPQARKFVWEKLKKNYVKKGIRDFWLDVAEPEYSSYDFENYRYYNGTVLEVGNQYPVMYTKMVYDGLTEMGVKDVVSLVRCAWAGSQKYGALVWSGDIPSTFESLKIQIVCGLQMAMAGIVWWNTDIGGFTGGDVTSPEFRELLIRWFQYATFCPVMRLHGDRIPSKSPMSKEGGGRCGSGADNEIWSYGEDAYEIMKHYIEIREQMRPYIRHLMEEAHQKGTPVMRPLFYEFPEDVKAWDIKDEFMFGEKILVAPVTEYQQRKREVYLPLGEEWTEQFSGRVYQGGKTVCAESPLQVIPVFVRREER